jgi:ubiquinone/menaquinone biosynthesis C-methylase UbiE
MVLDLTEECCRVGEMLTDLKGLSDRVAFKYGSALEIPFPGESFEAVWTQHSSMNIEDKEHLYAEIHRVLKPSGRLAIYEIVASAVQPIYFLVPWASNPGISFLQPAEAVQTLIREVGFREVIWVDVSKPSLEWFQQRASASESREPPRWDFTCYKCCF